MRCRTKALGPQVRGLRPALSVLMAECHNIAGQCGDLRLPAWPEVSKGTFVVVYSGPSIKSVQGRTGLPPEGLRGTSALTLEQVEPGEAGKTRGTRWLFCSRFCGEKAVCFVHSFASSQTLALPFRTAYERESNSQTEHFPVRAVS